MDTSKLLLGSLAPLHEPSDPRLIACTTQSRRPLDQTETTEEHAKTTDCRYST